MFVCEYRKNLSIANSRQTRTIVIPRAGIQLHNFDRESESHNEKFKKDWMILSKAIF